MRHRNFHILFIIPILLLAGCTGNDTPYRRESPVLQNSGDNREMKNEGDDLKNLELTAHERFQKNLDINQDLITNIAREESDDYQYYIPVEQLEKQPFIHANGDLKQNRHSNNNELMPGDLPESLEPFLSKSGRISKYIYFCAVFDNDIFNYTDYYYTNGIGFEFYHPGISASPLSQLLPGLKYSMNYFGVSLVQHLYTPLKLEYNYVLVGDRPFASYLTLSHRRISLAPDRHRRLQSEFVLGIIGPASLGGVAQDAIHSHEPVGWVNQVQNDFLLNYNIRFDQGLYSGKDIEVAIAAGGQAGTLYDNVMAGVYFQYGHANDRYGSVFQTTENQKPFKKRIRYYFSLDLNNKLVIYDATLQGGMFNRESVYTLDESQLKHYVFTAAASIGIGFGRYSLEGEQVFLTPEFDGGLYHLWFRIRNIVYID